MDNVEALYREHFAELHRWFRRDTGNIDDAADLAQDVFLKLSMRESLPGSVREKWAGVMMNLPGIADYYSG